MSETPSPSVRTTGQRGGEPSAESLTNRSSFGSAGRRTRPARSRPADRPDPLAPPRLIISEIGLGVSSPALPGVLAGSAFNGLPEQPRLNVLQLHNQSDVPIGSADLTVELLNPGGKVIEIAIPGDHQIPPGGFLMLYEQSIEVGSALVAIVTGAFLDTDGALLGQFRYPGTVPWELGADVSAKLAVNLVLHSDTAGETAIDTFAANLSPASLGVLRSPRKVACRRRSGLVLPADFEVLHGDLSPSPNVFSRVTGGR
ncbi:hypothetical protein [Pelagibius sp.]|uniref:hypothetical protein n=1 Tax=Pelagibius sp. TaxID=1931238 RepID=UPI003B50F2D9